MNIFVCIKQVPDTETKIVLKDDKTIDEAGIKWIMSPYDEYAVEEAIQYKEKNGDVEVVVVSVGPERAQEAIRTALAMGADRGVHVVADSFLEPGVVAAALANVIKNEGDGKLIFTGKMAIDNDWYQTHVRLARLLNAGVATNVNSIEYGDSGVVVSHEIGGGEQEKLELPFPSVIAVDKSLNKPRYPTLPNIMKAKKKEIKKLTPADAGIEGLENRLEIIGYEMPPQKGGGKKLEGEYSETVPELVKLLKDEAKAI
ncbi:MAG: electron transfer flavoprotein subunit beta/FixA family protein [Calditrichia bacterium]